MTFWQFVDKHFKAIVVILFLSAGLLLGSVSYMDILTTAQRYLYMTASVCGK